MMFNPNFFCRRRNGDVAFIGKSVNNMMNENE